MCNYLRALRYQTLFDPSLLPNKLSRTFDTLMQKLSPKHLPHFVRTLFQMVSGSTLSLSGLTSHGYLFRRCPPCLERKRSNGSKHRFMIIFILHDISLGGWVNIFESLLPETWSSRETGYNINYAFFKKIGQLGENKKGAKYPPHP